MFQKNQSKHNRGMARVMNALCHPSRKLMSVMMLMMAGSVAFAQNAAGDYSAGTTALGTIHPLGREKGILAGANVVMPNLSPVSVRKKYELYDNKICTGDEAAECRSCLQGRMRKIGYDIPVDRGDCIVK